MQFRNLGLLALVAAVVFTGCQTGDVNGRPPDDREEPSAGSGGAGAAGASAGRPGQVVQGGSGGSGAAAGASSPGGSGGAAGTPAAVAGNAGVSPDAGIIVDARRADDVGVADGASMPCSAVTFCEDFEAMATLDRRRWTKVETSGGNSVAVVADRVAHGTRAVRFHAEANTENAMMWLTNAPAALRAHHWGRAYFYVAPAPPQGHTALFTAGTLNGYPFGDDHLEISSNNNSWQLGAWGRAGETIAAGGRIPLARWACLEWEFEVTKGFIAVYVDGQRSFSFAAGGGKVPAFTDLGFGFRSWHPASNDIDLWMDDIALHPSRIGCLTPP